MSRTDDYNLLVDWYTDRFAMYFPGRIPGHVAGGLANYLLKDTSLETESFIKQFGAYFFGKEEVDNLIGLFGYDREYALSLLGNHRSGHVLHDGPGLISCTRSPLRLELDDVNQADIELILDATGELDNASTDPEIQIIDARGRREHPICVYARSSLSIREVPELVVVSNGEVALFPLIMGMYLFINPYDGVEETYFGDDFSNCIWDSSMYDDLVEYDREWASRYLEGKIVLDKTIVASGNFYLMVIDPQDQTMTTWFGLNIQYGDDD